MSAKGVLGALAGHLIEADSPGVAGADLPGLALGGDVEPTGGALAGSEVDVAAGDETHPGGGHGLLSELLVAAEVASEGVCEFVAVLGEGVGERQSAFEAERLLWVRCRRRVKTDPPPPREI